MNIDDFTQTPAAEHIYAKNEVPPFVITTRNTLFAMLTVGAETVFQGSYSPDFNGRISIDFAGLYDKWLKTTIPSSAGDIIIQNGFIQRFTATFKVLVGEDVPNDNCHISWYVANAKLKSATDFASWSQRNFLTNQPIEKATNYESPEWLTWLDSTGASTLVARFYPKAGGNLEATVFEATVKGCYSANVRYSRIVRMERALPSALKGYYDLILYDAKGEEACRQRYIYNERSGREKYYCFVNALGGIDTLICDGENVLQPETMHNIGRFANRYRALDDTDDHRKWTQGTGPMPNKHRNWAHELLTAKQGAQKYDPAAMDYYEIVVDMSEIAMGDFGQLAEASFGYIMSETGNVTPDTERAIDRNLHQSVADEAQEMDDLTQSAVVEFSNGTTTPVKLPANSVFVLFADSDPAEVRYYIDDILAGSFHPGTDTSPVVLKTKVGAALHFATEGGLKAMELKYYPEITM